MVAVLAEHLHRLGQPPTDEDAEILPDWDLEAAHA
jgi:hypothetical protein